MQSLHSWQGVHVTNVQYRNKTVLDALKQQAAEQPTAPFMTEVTSPGLERSLTFAEFDAFSRRAATWLRREHGVEKGSVIALSPRNELQSVVAVMGAIRCGAA